MDWKLLYSLSILTLLHEYQSCYDVMFIWCYIQQVDYHHLNKHQKAKNKWKDEANHC